MCGVVGEVRGEGWWLREERKKNGEEKEEVACSRKIWKVFFFLLIN